MAGPGSLEGGAGGRLGGSWSPVPGWPDGRGRYQSSPDTSCHMLHEINYGIKLLGLERVEPPSPLIHLIIKKFPYIRAIADSVLYTPT